MRRPNSTPRKNVRYDAAIQRQLSRIEEARHYPIAPIEEFLRKGDTIDRQMERWHPQLRSDPHWAHRWDGDR